jgi:hypothetical protein
MKGEGFSLGIFITVEAKNELDFRVGGRLEAKESDAHVPIIMTSKEFSLYKLLNYPNPIII